MIKNTIIVILLLLLLITFYAYMCLSNNMVDFQKERMQYIAKKDSELKSRENNLLSLTECNNNMNKYKNIIQKVSSDLTKTSNDFSDIVKYINQVNSETTDKINTPVLHEIPKIEEHFDNLENHEDALDNPIEDAFITALD